MSYLFLLVGLFLLLIGGDYLVKSSSALAKKLNISPFLIGLTVVSFGTSAPELLVSLNAAFNGSSGLAIGNVIGSNIANVALVLGFTSILKPLNAEAYIISIDLPIMVGVTLLFGIFIFLSRRLKRLEGIFLISIYIVYILNSLI